MTIITKLNISISSNRRSRDLVINAVDTMYSYVNKCSFVLAKVKNKFILDQAVLNVSNHFKFYLENIYILKWSTHLVEVRGFGLIM